MKLSVNNTYYNDWVIFDGEKHQIHSTCPEYPFLKDARFGLGVVTWDNIQPILLTPEILDKIEGMEQRELKDGYVLCDIKIHDDVDKYWVSIDRKILHIPHFHTLQQLIRLFTNKEIEIKW